MDHPRLGTRLEGWKSASKRPFEKKKNEGNRKCNEAMNIYNSYNSYNSNLFLLYSKTVKLNQSVGSHTQWNVSRHSPFHTFTFTSWFPEKTAQVDALP